MLLCGLYEIHSLLWEEQISREGRCFVGKYAHVDEVELGTGEEERTAEEQFSVQENELEKWLEDRVKKVSTLK